MIEILAIVEAAADFRTASGLADRLILEESPDWVGENIDAFRAWVGFEEGESFALWKRIGAIRKERWPRLRVLGHLQGKPLRSDGATARLVVAMAQQEQNQPDVIVFIRDLDVHSQVQERINSLNRVRSAFAGDFSIIIGVADPKREAWVLNGFVPQNQEEQTTLRQLSEELGFDPCTEAHRLRTVGTANPKEQRRNIKVVLEQLTGGDFDREQRCWTETPLETLQERGEHSYLSEYLNEIREFLLPLLGS